MTWYYVDKLNGNNTTGDGSYTRPWQTIATAVSLLSSSIVSGDRIRVRPTANYTERILINGIAGGTAGIVIEGDPDYGQAIPVVIGVDHDVLISDSSNFTIRNMELRLPTGSPTGNVIVQGTSPDITLEDLVIKDSPGDGILLTGTIARPIIRRCKITNSTTDGISAQQDCTNAIVEYCEIDKAGDNTYAAGAGDGISFHGGSNGIFRFNRIRRCSKGGITNVQNTGHTITCYGNLISDCVRWGMCGHQNGAETLGDHVWASNIIYIANTITILGGTRPFGMCFRGSTSENNEFRVYNNIVINPVDDSQVFSYGGEGFGALGYDITLIMRNNISVTTQNGGRHMALDANWAGFSTSINYNIYNSDANPKFVIDASAIQFAAWQAGAGADASGGVITSQLFVDESGIAAAPTGDYDWDDDSGRWSAAAVGKNLSPFNYFLKNTGQVQTILYPDYFGNFLPAGKSTTNIGAVFGIAAGVGFPGDSDVTGVLNSEQSAGPPAISSTAGKPSRAPKAIRFPEAPPRANLDRNLRKPVAVKRPKRMR